MTEAPGLCSQLHEVIRTLPSYQFGTLPSDLPTDGVYFCFEVGELGHAAQRVTRIGSHTGKGNLAARLREHVTVNKDRSIFRKHIGRAILSRNRDPFLADWNIDLTTKRARNKHAHRIDMTKQRSIEDEVSDYLQSSISFSVLSMANSVEAIAFETAAIGTVSNCGHCMAGSEWLGLHSPNVKISRSGLWQIRGLWGTELTQQQLRMLNA